jgi:hypothetical protein
MSSIEDNLNLVGVHHRVDCISRCLIISFFKLVSTLYEFLFFRSFIPLILSYLKPVYIVIYRYVLF